MKRTSTPLTIGRVVTYTSADGKYVARSIPLGWRTWGVDKEHAGGTHRHGPFRSEKEAMDQARSAVQYYELEHPNG
jgi:hypothetical protein